MEPLRLRAAKYFQSLQDEICRRLEDVDGKKRFRSDPWKHNETGGGITRVMENGTVFEKAGVNYSSVQSRLSETLAAKMKTTPQQIHASGISLVLHPLSPMVPTVHLNLRYLELESGDAWFGGGTDLTPYYLFEEDVRHFHKTLKSVCDLHDSAWYPRFKQWCDEYFFIVHRGEARGLGGIFFDYQREKLENVFAFVRSIGDVFLKAYLPIVERRKDEPWGTREKSWQLLRRGRYAEFNLVYDRGTLFGLETKGRTESILMSLPPEVRWQYDHQPELNSREAALLEVLRKPKGWI
jgi:coproporphyrinogen III oxidase